MSIFLEIVLLVLVALIILSLLFVFFKAFLLLLPMAVVAIVIIWLVYWISSKKHKHKMTKADFNYFTKTQSDQKTSRKHARNVTTKDIDK